MPHRITRCLPNFRTSASITSGEPLMPVSLVWACAALVSAPGSRAPARATIESANVQDLRMREERPLSECKSRPFRQQERPGMRVTIAAIAATLVFLTASPVFADQVADLIAGTIKQCRGCDLHGANFKKAELGGVDLTGANLTAATFHRAALRGA